MATPDFNDPEYIRKRDEAFKFIKGLEEVMSHNYPAAEMKEKITNYVKENQ